MTADEDDFLIAPERRSRRWLIAAGAAVLILLTAAGAWALFGHRPANTDAQQTPGAIEPAQVTTAASSPEITTTPSATETVEPTTSVTVPRTNEQTTSGGGVSKPASYPRAPYIVFRLKGTLYLARETGLRAIPLVKTAGVYALSPDARSLAFVDPVSHKLVVLDLTRDATRTIGPARQIAPVWSPDSSWLLAVRDTTTGTQVVRVDRTSGAVTVLGAGAGGSVSPDGSVIALLPSIYAQQREALVLLRHGAPWKTLKAPGSILDVVLGGDRAFVSVLVKGGSASFPEVRSLLFGGGGAFLTRIESADAGTLGSLTLSPNGSYLAYALTGDDGYSRMWIDKTAGGSLVDVSARKDYYPLWWASDSSAIFAIEGNSWQGEATSLVRIAPDGHKESVIVSGADR